MISSLMISISFFLLFYKNIDTNTLLGISVLIFILFYISSRKHSNNIFNIDEVAKKSRLNSVKAWKKGSLSIICLLLCLVLNNLYVDIVIVAISTFIIVILGKTNIKVYLQLMKIPMVFIFLGSIAILIEYNKNKIGLLNINVDMWIIHGYITITEINQYISKLVIFRSMGAISSLYILSLTTDLSRIIGLMRKMHIPTLFIDLMYLIYKCIFIIFEMYFIMKNSSKSRLGFRTYKTSIKTTGKIYKALLYRSYIKSSKMFDSMQSRCYDGKIDFLEID